MRRAVLLAATMAIVAVLAVGTASADPVNSKKVLISTFDCGGEQVTVTLLLNPSAIFSVVDTTGNFVLTRVEGTETITDPETGEVLDEFEFEFPIGQGQRTGLQGSLTTCDTTLVFEDPEVGTVTADLTFTGFFTPRKG
jgi:hypothetical protein